MGWVVYFGIGILVTIFVVRYLCIEVKDEARYQRSPFKWCLSDIVVIAGSDVGSFVFWPPVLFCIFISIAADALSEVNLLVYEYFKARKDRQRISQ